MQISINLPFDELLTVIKKLNPNEKKILKQERLKPKIGQILKKGFRIEL